mmetsp:Transcript_16704/g.35442  ORF Transcript_16704/g.35442 Transcript_16704/m.35442 type:complete len:281 (+) Transcript_16704:124-966(+)
MAPPRMKEILEVLVVTIRDIGFIERLVEGCLIQGLVHPPIIAAQARVQEEVWNVPSIDERHRVRSKLFQQLLFPFQDEAICSRWQGGTSYKVSKTAALVIAGVHHRKAVKLEDKTQHGRNLREIVLDFQEPCSEEFCVQYIGMGISHTHKFDLHRIERARAHLALSRNLLLESLCRGIVEEVSSQLQAGHQEVMILQRCLHTPTRKWLLWLQGIVIIDVLQRGRLGVGCDTLEHLGADRIQQLLAHLDGENNEIAFISRLGQGAEVLGPHSCSIEESVAT